MRDRFLWLLLGSLAFAVAGLALHTRSLGEALERLEQRFETSNAQAAGGTGVDTNIRASEWRSADPQPYRSRELEDRLTRVEDEIVALWQLGSGDTQASPALTELEREEDQPANVPPAPARVVIDRYENEQTVSEWGHRSATNIQEATGEYSFFSAYGGEVVADCKETSCRVRWFLPNLDELLPDERERVLMMARSELTALAVQNSSDVDRLDAAWDLDGHPPSVSLFFNRQE